VSRVPQKPLQILLVGTSSSSTKEGRRNSRPSGAIKPRGRSRVRTQNGKRKKGGAKIFGDYQVRAGTNMGLALGYGKGKEGWREDYRPFSTGGTEGGRTGERTRVLFPGS